ncbi:hypothetical protein KP509_38G059100 [Ceratopteris richardii]|nr:hypothetical protein KP509_38G059100 [Ceratopteris richardii]
MSTKELFNRMWKDVYEDRLTVMKRYGGAAMEPTIYDGEKILVRKIPFPSTRTLFVGDVILHKHHGDSTIEQESCLGVARIAAMEGEEMVSTNENDLPFVLQKGECWVLFDNEAHKTKDCTDSRSFGPLSLGKIIGRVLYAFKSSTDHGQVKNSQEAMYEDSSVLSVELDLDELASSENK